MERISDHSNAMTDQNQTAPRRTKVVIGTLAVLLIVGGWALHKHLDGSGQPASISSASPTNDEASTTVNDPSSFRVLSDETNATERIVKVRRGGREATLKLIPGVEMSQDDLEAMAFPDHDEPKRGNPEAILNRQLSFYGMTVDGDSNALAGADVEASVFVITTIASEGYKTFRTVSDGSGRFFFEVPWGQKITVRPSELPDYITPPEQQFLYGPVGPGARHQPNPGNPVIFTLHKKKQAEDLVSFEKVFFAPPSGQPIHIDLASGEIVTGGGDLVVSAECPEPFTNLKKIPWKLSVEAVGGGLVDVSMSPRRLEFLPEAPLDGYQPGFKVEYGPDTPDYNRQYEGLFYLRSQNGKIYAKVRFDMNTRWGARGVPIVIAAVVNTNGSRYLHVGP